MGMRNQLFPAANRPNITGTTPATPMMATAALSTGVMANVALDTTLAGDPGLTRVSDVTEVTRVTPVTQVTRNAKSLF